MRTLVKNIKELVGVESTPQLRKQGKEMARLETVKDAYLLVEDGKINAFGEMKEWPVVSGQWSVDREVNAAGRMVSPSFCDSHTHIVYANSREHEFVDKIRGLSYEEIAKRGGGILNSAKATAAASEDELYDMAKQRLEEVMHLGTGAIEIKSGYGLNTAYAMGVSKEVGSIAVGKKANFYITKPIPSYEYMPYSFGENKVERVFLNGEEV